MCLNFIFCLFKVWKVRGFSKRPGLGGWAGGAGGGG